MVKETFEQFLRTELTSIPLEHWSDYLPIHVAALRFLERIHPRNFSFDRAHSLEKFYSFEGVGARWYEDNIWALSEMQELSHALLVATLGDIKKRYPQGVDTADEVKVPAGLAEKIELLLVQKTAVFGN